MTKKIYQKRFLALCWLLFLIGTGIALLYGSFPRLPSPEKPLHLYCNQAGDDLKDLFLLALSEAEVSVQLAVYGLSDPKLIRQLNAKALEGLSVHVIVDATASSDAAHLLHPSIQLTPRQALGLMHLKILVTDSCRCWIGTSNWTTPSLRSHGNLVAGIYDPSLAQEISHRVFSNYLHPAHQRCFSIGKQEVECWILPDDEGALERLIQLIEGAQDHLRISMFTWTHPRLHTAVAAAWQRGIDVQIVMDRASSRTTSVASYRALSSAQVPVRQHLGLGMHHYKMLWVDGHTLVLGSANWTRSAFSKNNDCFLVISHLDHELQEFMTRVWRKIWLEAKNL